MSSEELESIQTKLHESFQFMMSEEEYCTGRIEGEKIRKRPRMRRLKIYTSLTRCGGQSSSTSSLSSSSEGGELQKYAPKVMGTLNNQEANTSGPTERITRLRVQEEIRSLSTVAKAHLP